MSDSVMAEGPDGDIFVFDPELYEAEVERIFQALSDPEGDFSLDSFIGFAVAARSPYYVKAVVIGISEAWTRWLMFEAPRRLIPNQMLRLQALALSVRLFDLPSTMPADTEV